MNRLLFLLPLMACGDDGGATPADAPVTVDGDVADAPTDAPPSSGSVTLTIRSDDEPVEGADVYFQNPDGSLAAKVATNTSGVANATVQAGGSVTVVDPFANAGPTGLSYSEVRTFAGVKPGDQLLLEQGGGSAPITINLTLPTITNGVTWEVSTSCGGDFLIAATSELGLYDCGGTADFVVIAYDDQDNMLGYFYKPNVTVAADASVSLASETYTAVPDATFAYSNIPAQFAGVSTFNLLVSPRGPVYQVGDEAALTAGAGTITLQRPLANPTTSLALTNFEEASPSLTDAIALTWQPTAAAATFDGATRFLPMFSQAPTYAAATRQLSWTSTGGSAQPEFVIARLSTIRETPLRAWRWEMVAPYSGTNVTFPMLPTEIADYIPLATDSTVVQEVVNAKAPGGYDAVRGRLLTSDGPEELISGPSGEIVAVSINEDGGPNPTIRGSATAWSKVFDRAAKAKATAKAKLLRRAPAKRARTLTK